MRASFGVVVWFGLVVSACSAFKPADTLRPQAAYDLRCAPAQLQLTALSGSCDGTKLGNRYDCTYDCTYGVRCGDQQVTYSHVPDTDTWIMNSSRLPQ